MTISSVGWLKTVGLKDYDCNACGWNVTAGEPRVYAYAGEGRPHKVWTRYRLNENKEPFVELGEEVHYVYHYDCYNNPPKMNDDYELTGEPHAGTRLLDIGEGHD